MSSWMLDVKRPIELVLAILDKFSGEQYVISITGDLSAINISELETLTEGGMGTLTLLPHVYNLPPFDAKVLVCRLSQKNVAKLKSLIRRIGIRSKVAFIEVKRDNDLIFESADNFGKEQVWISSVVGQEFVQNLLHDEIIRKFEVNKYDSE
jgi:hypothetical protein